MMEIVKNPAVWAALSGLMSALGWENADKFFDHIVGFIGAGSALAGMALGGYRSLKDRKKQK